MKQLQSVGAGLAAAIVGALIWAAIAYYANFEIGWIAWGIGGLVGVAVFKFEPNPGLPSGLIAVVLTCASIAGGKYLGVHFSVNKFMNEMQLNEPPDLADQELVVSYVADEVVVEHEANGRTVAWPRGVDPSEAAAEADYPADVWREASDRWSGMSVDEQDDYRAGIVKEYHANVSHFRSVITNEAFKDSFGFIDIIFFLLGIVTAYKLGAGGVTTD